MQGRFSAEIALALRSSLSSRTRVESRRWASCFGLCPSARPFPSPRRRITRPFPRTRSRSTQLTSTRFTSRSSRPRSVLFSPRFHATRRAHPCVSPQITLDNFTRFLIRLIAAESDKAALEMQLRSIVLPIHDFDQKWRTLVLATLLPSTTDDAIPPEKPKKSYAIAEKEKEILLQAHERWKASIEPIPTSATDASAPSIEPPAARKGSEWTVPDQNIGDWVNTLELNESVLHTAFENCQLKFWYAEQDCNLFSCSSSSTSHTSRLFRITSSPQSRNARKTPSDIHRLSIRNCCWTSSRIDCRSGG